MACSRVRGTVPTELGVTRTARPEPPADSRFGLSCDQPELNPVPSRQSAAEFELEGCAIAFTIADIGAATQTRGR